MKILEDKIQQLEKQLQESRKQKQEEFLLTEMKKIGIEKLPYSYSSLKRFIDAETMNVHYNKHYKGYVDKLNAALKKKKYGDTELEKIIKNISKYDENIRNNAGGAFNHALFWNMLSPTPIKLKGELYNKISNEFGTFTKFKKKFELAAKSKFGSGWVWLILTKNNTLKIMTTPNQDNPLMNVVKNGGFPLLGLDLWEHAYYLKYKNKRDEYISNFWDVVNWDFVTKLYEMKVKTKLAESEEMRNLLSVNVEPSFCSAKDSQLFRSIRERPEIKRVYQSGIDEILKSKFGDFFRSKTDDQMSGFYDYERENARSVLSNLNSNNATFCLLVNAVNKEIERMGQWERKFNFWKEEKRTLSEVERFLRALKYFKDQIFNPSNPDFVNIIRVLLKIWLRGEKTESETVAKMQEYFAEQGGKVKKIGGAGVPMDAMQGIDATLDLGYNLYTIQIKPYYSTEVHPDFIKVLSASSTKPYNVDWIVFYHNQFKNILIFKNNPISTTLDYVFPVESLIHEIE